MKERKKTVRKITISLILALITFTVLIPLTPAKAQPDFEKIEVYDLGDGIWRFEEYINYIDYSISSDAVVGYYKVNIYAIESEDKLILIDSGVEHLAGWLHSNITSATGKSPNAVLLTHAHADHAGGAAYFHVMGAEVYTHLWSQYLIFIGMNFSLIDPTYAYLVNPNFVYTPGYAPINLYDLTDPGVESLLLIDGAEFIIIWTPGHSPGSVSIIYNNPSGKYLLFTGDTTMPRPEDDDPVPFDLTYELDYWTLEMIASVPIPSPYDEVMGVDIQLSSLNILRGIARLLQRGHAFYGILPGHNNPYPANFAQWYLKKSIKIVDEWV